VMIIDEVGKPSTGDFHCGYSQKPDSNFF